MECAIDYSDAAYTYHTIYYGDIYRRFNNGNELHIAGNGTFGINESDLANQLAEGLPEAVNHLTPQGTLPAA